MPEEKKERVRSAARSSLPLVSKLPTTEDVRHVTHLLHRLAAIKAQLTTLETEELDIKQELAAHADANDLKGFRHGLVGFEYRGYSSREVLSKEKLVENGCPAEIIAKSMIAGKAYLDCRLVVFDIE